MNLLVSAMALLMACAAFVIYDLATFRDVITRNLSVQAQMLGSNSVAAIMFADPNSAESTLAALREAPTVVAAAVYSGDGKMFAAYRRDRAVPVPMTAETVGNELERHWYSAGTLKLVRRIFFQGQPMGFIFIESDLEALNSRLRRYLFISALVLLGSMAAASAASAALTDAVVKPISALAEAARAVALRKDCPVRVDTTGPLNELAMMGDAFNNMLDQIERRDRELLAARDHLELRVEQRTAELAAANKELESFSYSVSHDLRAPLRSIDGFSQALLEDYGDKFDAEARGHFERIRAATRRMGVLIDDLLNLAQVTRADMRREPVDLSAIARSVAADIRKSDGERRVECVIGDGIEAEGDPRLLRVVMDNLLRNAWKYTSKHPTARIEFGQTQMNGGRPVLFVRDDGAGFDPAYAGKLFGAFQRLHGAADFPGTGVGLATVHRILQRHGGRIWAEAEVEKGATFYFVV